MYKQLKFVQGAVAKKDFLPAMTHFAIENRTVRSYNGSLALCAPIELDITCKPKAASFVQAIANCKDGDTPVLAMTAAGRLSIKSGSFKAFIECVIEEETPHVLPEGERVDFNGAAVLKALEIIQNFIGEDASRPWCNGVLLRGECAYATNNVSVIEYWIGANMPITVNIPKVAVLEMLRINEPPTHAQVTPTSMTFHYSDGRWIRTQLLGLEWPDLTPILNRTATPLPVDDRLFVGLGMLKPFVDKSGRVFIENHVMSTTPEMTQGAHYDLPHDPVFLFEGVYNIQTLMLLEKIAQTVDLTAYPQPCLFFGDNLRGAIIGMRKVV